MNPSKCVAVAGAALALCWIGRSTAGTRTPAAGAAQRSRSAEKQGLAEPFKGITTDGRVVSNLFAIRSTGVATDPVRKAADAFLAALSADQRAKPAFPVDERVL